MGIEVTELIWQDVCVRNKVKVLFPELLLHPHHVEAESVLPGDLIALWKVVDLLVLIQTFI